MITKEQLLKLLQSDINDNIAIRPTIRNSLTLPLGILSIIAAVGITLITASLYWIVSSFSMWGIYSLYSLLRLFIDRKKPNMEALTKEAQVKKYEIFLQLFAPFQEAIGFVFMINLILLLFVDIPFRTSLLVIAGVYCLSTLLFSISRRIFVKGFRDLLEMTNPHDYLSKMRSASGKKGFFFGVLLLILVFLLIVFGIYLMPFYLLFVSIRLVLWCNLSWKILMILIVLQFVALYLLVSFMGSKNAISKLNRQLAMFREFRDRLQSDNRVPKKALEEMLKKYQEEKKLKLVPITFMKMDIWIAFYDCKLN